MGSVSQRVLQLGIVIVVIGLVFGMPRPSLAAVTCPARSAAMPVVRWLVDRLDSVTIHRFQVVNGSLVEPAGYPKTSADPAFLKGVLSLSGSYVRWNGYDSPSPFGAFYYPRY